MSKGYRTVVLRLYDEDEKRLRELGILVMPTGYLKGAEHTLSFPLPKVKEKP